LQLDPLRSFASALDARDDLDLILGDTDDFASLTSLEGFLERVEQRMPFPGMEQDREPQVEIEPDRRRDVVLADIDAALELPQVEAPALHRIDAATVLPFGPQTGAEASTDRTVTTAPEPVAPVEDLVEQTPAASSEAQYYRAPETTNAPPARNQTARTMTAGLVAAVVAAIAGYAAASRGPLTASKVLAPGAVELSTGPAGIDAFIDGTFRGLTPLTITLAPGLHTIDLGRPQSKPQSIPVSIHAGMKISQFVELPLAAEFGEEAELRMADVSKRAVDSGRLVDRGSVTVVSEATLRIVEGDAVIGSSRDRLELPVGRHELTLVDEASGINTTRVVQVDVKKPAVLKVAVPMGVLAVSTTPGAEVWVDGNKRGETPIGSLALRAGAHDIVFRHPDFGDRRRAVVVTAGDLLQLSVDLRAR
jgi:hypothetical protein